MSKKIQLPKFRSSEITPESIYLSRRRFFKTAAIGAAGAALLAACRNNEIPLPTQPGASTSTPESVYTGSLTDEFGSLLDHRKGYHLL